MSLRLTAYRPKNRHNVEYLSTNLRVDFRVVRNEKIFVFVMGPGSPGSGGIPQNQGWSGCAADIAPVRSVQKIFKKVKKRLVSLRKPR